MNKGNVTDSLAPVGQEEVVELKIDPKTGLAEAGQSLNEDEAVAVDGFVKKKTRAKITVKKNVAASRSKGGQNLLAELKKGSGQNSIVQGQNPDPQFPLKPRLEGKSKGGSKANAVFVSNFIVHTPKAYDALNGRPPLKDGKNFKRAIPNIFSFASRSGVIIDYAVNGDNHVMAYQFLLRLEEMLKELEEQIDLFDKTVEGLVEKYTDYGVVVSKLESSRPSVFSVTIRNPYALRLLFLALKYDHVERVFLPMRNSGMFDAKVYRESHRPIQALFTRIKSLPDMFSTKRKYNGEVVEAHSKLAESLDLKGFVKYSREAREDEDKMNAINVLFGFVGEPTEDLIKGNLKPELVPSLKGISLESLTGSRAKE